MAAVLSYTRTWAFLQYLTELINFPLLEVLSLHQAKIRKIKLEVIYQSI